MHCNECDYPLWNLTTRTCPECGTTFRPSEFEFKAYTVEFHCPHCDQMYFGTDVRGHLVPRAFECVHCGEPIEMDEMVLRPAHGLDDSQTEAYTMPWLDRQRRGLIKSWFTTIGHSMVLPTKLMAAVPPSAPVGEAWLFALLSIAAFTFVGVTLPLAGIGLIGLVAGSNPSMFVMGLIALPVSVLATAISIVIWGAVAHGVLRLTGTRTASMGRTYQAMCYSIGPMAISAIPCLGSYCGGYAGSIWWLVCAILMLTVAHNTSGLRATLAAIGPPLLGVLAMIALVMAPIILASTVAPLAPARSVQVGGTRQNVFETRLVVDAIQAWQTQHADKPLSHGLQLMVDGPLAAWDLVGSTTGTTPSDVPVAYTTLEQMQYVGPNRQRAIVEEAADKLPDDVVAHRVGDFVFTFHGIDPETNDGRLWLVVFAPDPDMNAAAGSSRPLRITVGQADGMVATVRLDGGFDALTQQNELREKAGLPPLKDPRTITHDEPQRAGQSDD